MKFSKILPLILGLILLGLLMFVAHTLGWLQPASGAELNVAPDAGGPPDIQPIVFGEFIQDGGEYYGLLQPKPGDPSLEGYTVTLRFNEPVTASLYFFFNDVPAEINTDSSMTCNGLPNEISCDVMYCTVEQGCIRTIAFYWSAGQVDTSTYFHWEYWDVGHYTGSARIYTPLWANGPRIEVSELPLTYTQAISVDVYLEPTYRVTVTQNGFMVGVFDATMGHFSFQDNHWAEGDNVICISTDPPFCRNIVRPTPVMALTIENGIPEIGEVFTVTLSTSPTLESLADYGYSLDQWAFLTPPCAEPVSTPKGMTPNAGGPPHIVLHAVEACNTVITGYVWLGPYNPVNPIIPLSGEIQFVVFGQTYLPSVMVPSRP